MLFDLLVRTEYDDLVLAVNVVPDFLDFLHEYEAHRSNRRLNFFRPFEHDSQCSDALVVLLSNEWRLISQAI